jgi:hypothetical protein
MKPIIFALVALFWSSSAFAADAPQVSNPIAPKSSFVWVKLTSSMSTTSSKPGDPVTAFVMGPGEGLEGATIEGTVDLAYKCTLTFTFHTLKLNGKAYPIQSRLIAIENSKGIAGQDDLGQRVGVTVSITAYGLTTALNEGSEVQLSIWQKN